MTRLVAWRRGHRARKNNPDNISIVSPYTVNHTTEQLRKVFTRAKLWGVRFQHEPTWPKHMLPVPSERVRELSEDEADRLDTHVRDDYAPFFEFARATGWRLRECLLCWTEVDWTTGQIVKHGKGGKRITRRITSDLRALLWPLRGHHPVFVFTYMPTRSNISDEKLARRPITYGGLQSYWQRLRKRAGVEGFRFHDYRHDFGTKLLRRERNLRLVQKAMHHSDIKTTLRYAHVLDEEVGDALERGAKSRTKSRTRLKVV